MGKDVFAGWDQGFALSDANAAYDRGQFARAAELYREALASDPSSGAVAVKLASALLLSSRFAEADAAARRAVELSPQSAPAAVMAAGALMSTGDLDGAVAFAERAVRLDPELLDAALCKADLLSMTGHEAESARLLAGVVEKHRDDPRALAAISRQELPPERAREVADQLLAAARREDVPEAVRAIAAFSAGPLYEKLKDYDAAFEAFGLGNSLLQEPFDPAAHARAIDELIAAWPSELPSASPGEKLPVFIVGMPRSGTTLVEQILSSHPEVFGAGELPLIPRAARTLLAGPPGRALAGLTHERLESQAGEILRDLRGRSTDAARVTDKLPQNFLHLGLIRALFPDAAIIHCTRRPIDTALSCWQHNFRGSLPWSNSFEGIAAFYQGHEKLMQHWVETCRIGVLRVPLEELTADPETWSRAIVDHVGLAWDERCLSPQKNARVALTASVRQVKKKIYRNARGRAAAYGDLLDPLRLALRDAGVPQET